MSFLKHIFMKKYLLLSLFFCLSFLSIANGKTDKTSNDKTSNDKTIIKKHIPTFEDRSGFASTEAIYRQKSETIDITCFDMKQVSVYIMDSEGNILYQDAFDSILSPFYILGAPTEPGNYTLIIDSPVCYAEGYFTVK